jgi:hypothetical protein
MNALGLIYQEDKEKIENSWQETFAQDIQQANYDEETEEGIKQFINDILSGKVKLKAHPSQKIHAKIYIFRPVCWAILGNISTPSAQSFSNSLVANNTSA